MKQMSTQLMIHESLRKLLRVKALDRITVRDIVEDCNLTRNTFYYHYEDVYDLFEDYLQRQTDLVYSELPPDVHWDQALLKMIQAVFETPQVSKNIFQSTKRDTMLLYLHKMIQQVIAKYIESSEQWKQCSGDDCKLIASSITYGLYGLLEEWLTGPDAFLLEQNLQRLVFLYDGAIRNALEKCSKSNYKGGITYER